MSKQILFIISLILWLWYSPIFIYAQDAQQIAQEYIDTNRETTDFWKEKNPRIWESTPLYMEKETPSYIEYSIICDREQSCWFVLVNIDWDDVQVPMTSPSDTSPSQILSQKAWESKENLKFYYFSPFSIYTKNLNTEEIRALDPQVDSPEDIFDADTEEKGNAMKQTIQSQKNNLPILFQQQLNAVKEYKQSEEFQQFKQEKDTIVTNALPSNGTWKYVAGNTVSECNSRVPCYQQYKYWYNWQYCASWCSPVAAAIIFGYYDRNNYPNLIPGSVGMINSSTTPASLRTAIDQIRGYMGTTCSTDGQWSTNPYNVENAKQYITYRNYISQNPKILWPSAYTVMENAVIEIVNNRPFIMNIVNFSNGTINAWHSVVLYGFYTNTSSWYWVEINAGWWQWNYSNHQLNLSSFVFGDSAYNKILSINKFIIE